MSSGTLLIGRTEAMKALGDPNFLNEFPMFRSIQNKSEMLRKSASSGCSSCRQRHIAEDLTRDFLNVLKLLPREDAVRIKNYFGAEKMIYSFFDRDKATCRTEIV